MRDPDGNIVPFGLTGPHGPTGVQGPRGYPGIGIPGPTGEFNWLVHGVRSDIQVEPNRSDVTLFGNGPYKWIVQY